MVSVLRVPDRSPHNGHLDISTLISLHERRKWRREAGTAMAGTTEDHVSEVPNRLVPIRPIQEENKHCQAYYARVQVWVRISRTHVKLGTAACVCNPGASVGKWEAETDLPKVLRTAILVYRVANHERPCLNQGRRYDLHLKLSSGLRQCAIACLCPYSY